jgi:hypothetical protein
MRRSRGTAHAPPADGCMHPHRTAPYSISSRSADAVHHEIRPAARAAGRIRRAPMPLRTSTVWPPASRPSAMSIATSSPMKATRRGSSSSRSATARTAAREGLPTTVGRCPRRLRDRRGGHRAAADDRPVQAGVGAARSWRSGTPRRRAPRARRPRAARVPMSSTCSVSTTSALAASASARPAGRRRRRSAAAPPGPEHQHARARVAALEVRERRAGGRQHLLVVELEPPRRRPAAIGRGRCRWRW